MTVVAADGQHIQPVVVDEFRIAAAETYDVIVEPDADRAYTLFAQSMIAPVMRAAPSRPTHT